MPNKWIQKADIKEGAFTEWAKKHGYNVEHGIPFAAIVEAQKSKDAHVVKMANLAATFKKMNKGK